MLEVVERASLIIPIFNEAQHITSVVEAAKCAKSIERVIVVDNNCTDNSAQLALEAGAEVIVCKRQGKGWAMHAGVEHAEGQGAEVVTFADGDLIGVEAEHIDQYTEPVLIDEARMCIGYLGGRPEVSRYFLQFWGGFSGQRCLSIADWNALRPSDLKASRTEGALNALYRNSGLGHRITRVELEGLRHKGKREKEATLTGAGISYLRTYSSAVRGLASRSSLK